MILRIPEVCKMRSDCETAISLRLPGWRLEVDVHGKIDTNINEHEAAQEYTLETDGTVTIISFTNQDDSGRQVELWCIPPHERYPSTTMRREELTPLAGSCAYKIDQDWSAIKKGVGAKYPAGIERAVEAGSNGCIILSSFKIEETMLAQQRTAVAAE